jgi:ubiquinone/menaquinone biosynthesis C-methylase UbiE
MYEVSEAPVIKPDFDWLFKRISGEMDAGRILDVGCETGYLLSKLNSPPESLYGVDIAFGAIRKANDRVKGGNFCVADVRNMPYESDSFDYLTCTELLEHIENDEVLKECFRVLRPGGTAFFTVPNGSGVAAKYMCSHIRFFTFQSIKNHVQEAGFEITSGKKCGLYIPFVTSFFTGLSYDLGRNVPFTSKLWSANVPEFLSVNFYIKCSKPVAVQQSQSTLAIR